MNLIESQPRATSTHGFCLAVLIFAMAMAPTSYAQINLQIFPNGSSNEIRGNRNAMTADFTSLGAGLVVTGSLLANSPLTTTTLTISYPAAITSNNVGPIPASDGLRIEGSTGVFATAAITTVQFSSGRIDLSLPGFGSTTNTLSGSFRLVGVRIDTTGLSAPVTATFSLNTSSNNYLLSTPSGTVITTLGDGIGSLALGARSGATDFGTATLLTNATVSDNTASLLITEGFASAWRTSFQSSGSNTSLVNGVQAKLTFAGIQSGMTLTLSNPSSSPTLTGVSIDDTELTASSGDNDSTISFTGTSLTAVEEIQIDVTVSLGPGTTSLSVGSVTAAASLAPEGAALDSNNVPTASGGYPRFVPAEVGSVANIAIGASPAIPVAGATNPVPTVIGLVPAKGPPGISFAATLFGANLTGATSIDFTGTGVTGVVGSGGTSSRVPLSVTIDSDAPSGPRLVTVTTSLGISVPFEGFAVEQPQPRRPASPLELVPAVEQGIVITGYAIVTPDPTTPVPVTFVTLRLMEQGLVVSQADIPVATIATTASLFADVASTINRRMGVAVINPGSARTDIAITLVDQSGAPVASSTTMAVEPYSQVARFLGELFPAAAVEPAFTGHLSLRGDLPFAVVALSFNGRVFAATGPRNAGEAVAVPERILQQVGPFTTAKVGGPLAQILPQVAFGGGWVTQIALVNTGASLSTGRLDVFDSDGLPLAVKFDGETNSTVEYSIPAGGTLVLTPR